MASMPIPESQVTIVTQRNIVDPPSNAGAEKYAKTFHRLGITQLVFATICLIMGIAVLAYALGNEAYYWNNIAWHFYIDGYAYVGTGIWTSAFFFTSGLLGIYQGKNKNRCLLVAALTMTIFSALAACTLFGLEVAGAVSASYYANDEYYKYSRSKWNVSLGLHSTLSFLAFGQLVTSIVHSAYCCGAQCCQTSSGAVSSTTHAYVNSGHLTAIPAQIQPTFVQGAPVGTGIHGQVVHQPVIHYQVPVQGGFVATQPNVYHPAETSNEQPPPVYQNLEKS